MCFFFCRFWWEADGVFSQQQRSQLYKVSLSGIMCDNSDTGELPRDPFRFNKYPSEYVPCAEIPSMNLDAWREDKSRGGFDHDLTIVMVNHSYGQP